MSDRFNPRLSPIEETVAEKARPAKRLPILCLDFDGVLHGYQSGWQGAAIIPDPPVPGAVEFLHSAVERFQVAIYSSRSGQPGGIDAMRGWLTMWLLAVIEDRREAEHVLSLIQWPTEKPAAIVSIDDRAIQFTGEWPSLDEIAGFKSWNKRPAPDSTRTGDEGTEEARLIGPKMTPEQEERIAHNLCGEFGPDAVVASAAFVKAFYAELYAAARPAAPEAQGAWREIDDEARDGSHWLVARPGAKPVRAYFEAGEWWMHGRGRLDRRPADLTGEFAPTHYQPLPAPPASSSQES